MAVLNDLTAFLNERGFVSDDDRLEAVEGWVSSKPDQLVFTISSGRVADRGRFKEWQVSIYFQAATQADRKDIDIEAQFERARQTIADLVKAFWLPDDDWGVVLAGTDLSRIDIRVRG